MTTPVHSEPLDVHQVRPRFKVLTQEKPEDIASRMNEYLERKDTLVKGKVYARYGKLRLPTAQQHYWSPQLGLTMEETEEGTLIRGLIGPKPSVWTMFVFFYTAIGFSTLIVGIVGLSHWTIGESPTILWAVPVLILVFLSLYLIASMGKLKSREEMRLLLNSFRESSGLEIPSE